MALLLLATRWQQNRRATGKRRPRLRAMTVDHGLRAEAQAEAVFVADQCANLGVYHSIHRVTEPAPESGVQAWARDVRYTALKIKALVTDCTAIATGHQSEDQAETVLMRLARGAGIDGLAAMASSRMLGDRTLLRPLLTTPRARLTTTLQANGMKWIDDPSNHDARFERSAFQTHSASLEALGLTPAALGVSAKRLRDARDALRWSVDQALAQMPECRVALDTAAYGVLQRSCFNALPFHIRTRIMRHVLNHVRGETKPIRLDRLEDLVNQLGALSSDQSETFTLGGCLIATNDNILNVFREPGRNGFPVLHLSAGDCGHWDNRFFVEAPEDGPPQIEVRALSDPPADATSDIETYELQQLPKAAREAIPAFWSGVHLLAVPQIGHVAGEYRIKTTLEDKLPDMFQNAAVTAPRTFVSLPIAVQLGQRGAFDAISP